MLWHRALQEYDYAMRVDDDVCITRFPSAALEAALAADFSYGREVAEAGPKVGPSQAEVGLSRPGRAPSWVEIAPRWPEAA